MSDVTDKRINAARIDALSTDPEGTDLSESVDTAGRVSVGGSATGVIDHGGDRDWFAVTLDQGHTYRFDLEGAPTGAGTLPDAYLRGIHDAQGNLIAGTMDNNAGEGLNARKTFTAETSGTYYVSAGAWGHQQGTYKLTATDLTAADAHTEDTSTTGTIAAGGSATGAIDYGGDRDWFAVTLEQGHTYRFDLEGAPTGAGTLPDAYLRGIHDAQGNLIAGTTDNSGGEGRNARKTFTAETSGTYYVSAGAWGDQEGTYRLTATDLTDLDEAPTQEDPPTQENPPTPEDAPTSQRTPGSEPEDADLPQAVTTQGRVSVNGPPVTGKIESLWDQDWFAVELVAGREYTIDVRGRETGDGTLIDPTIFGVFDSEGDWMPGTYGDDGGVGINARVSFTVPEDGTYYVSPAGNGDTYSGIGTYELEVRSSDTEETSDVTGADEDEAPTFVEARYTFVLAENVDGSETPVALGTVAANDPEGAAPTYSIVGGNESGLFTINAATGELFYTGAGEDYESGTTGHELTVRASDGSLHSDVAVSVSVTDVDEPLPTVSEGSTDLPAGIDTTGRVLVGESASGEIRARDDRDWFAVELTAGTTYLFALEGSGTEAGTLSEPYLAGIYDAEGGLMGGTSGHHRGEGRNVRVAFTAPEDGTYYASAGAEGDQQGSYRLTVTKATSSIHVSDAEAHESDGVLVFRVSLDEASAQPVTVRYATADGTAVAGEDYEPVSGELEFAPGETEKDVEVPLIDDSVEDSGETFGLWLGDAVGALLADSEATGTIYNSELAMTVSEGTMDFPADTSTPGRVVVGETAAGRIDPKKERDWFAVELEAGKTYRIELEGQPRQLWKPHLWNPYLYGIHDSEGNLIPGTTDEYHGLGYNAAMVTFTPTVAGTYYVSAGGGRHQHVWGLYASGPYWLSVTDAGALDTLTAGTDTTGTVAVNGTTLGAIDYGRDRDWYAVELQEGRTYWFDVEGESTGAGDLEDPYLRGIYDSDGTVIAGTTDNNSGIGRNAWLIYIAKETGTHYMSAGSVGQYRGTYRVGVTDITDAYMQTFDPDMTPSLAVDGSVTSSIDAAGDRDWYAMTLEANVIYRVLMEGSYLGAGTLGNPYLYGIHDSDGNLIARTTNDNGARRNPDSWVFFRPSEAGTYYVSAGAHRADTGTYKLSLKNTISGDAQTAGTDTSGRIGGTQTVLGEIDYPYDADWYAVEMEAGGTYLFDLDGIWLREIADTLLEDPFLAGIYDSAGNLIPGTEDNNGGFWLDSHKTFRPAETGTYYVSARSFGSGTGPYKLELTTDLHSAWTNTIGRLPVDGSVQGDIAWDRDRDWFAVTLEAGDLYRFNLSGARRVWIEGIYDSDGTRVESGAWAREPLFLMPSEDGTYYVGIVGRRSKYKETVSYTLSVEDLSGASVADRSTSIEVGGSVRGAISYDGEVDWVAFELEAGTAYRIDIDPESTYRGKVAAHLWGVYDSDVELVPDTTNTATRYGNTHRIEFTPSADGTYYVAAGAGGDVLTHDYTLSVEEL